MPLVLDTRNAPWAEDVAFAVICPQVGRAPRSKRWMFATSFDLDCGQRNLRAEDNMAAMGRPQIEGTRSQE